MATQCLGRNRDNSPCSAWVPAGRAYCQWHDPDREAERRAWRAKGGAHRSNRARARRELTTDAVSLRDAAGIMGRLLRRLENGQAEPGVVSAAAAAVRALASLEQATTHEDRIAELERAAGIDRSA